MKKIAYIIASSGLLIFSTSAVAEQDKLQSGQELQPAPVSLYENIMVDGAYVRLGDLFSNVPLDRADTAVAYAPKPGRRAAFDARWLFRVARAYGLQWRPLSIDIKAVVTRNSITIQQEEIKDALMSSLTEFNLPENPEIELSNRNIRIHVPANTLPEVTVEDINYNQRSKRFSAIISAGEKLSNNIQRVRITGQVHNMIDVPTLARRIAKGEVIKENDIAWLKLRADRTQRDVIVDADALIGMTPKRHLRAEIPVRARDVQRPVLVSKGSLVTIILKSPA